MVLSEALKQISEKFEQKNLPLVLIGGFAVNWYGATRVTVDVDFLLCHNDFEKVRALFLNLGYTIENQNELFCRFAHKDLAIKGIDFVFVDSKTFNEIHSKTQEAKMAGLHFRVPHINHLIALKLHAVKGNVAHREYKDLPDVLELIRINRINPKSEDFKSLCLKYGSDEIYKKILEHK